MAFLDDLLQNETLQAVRDKILALIQSNEVPATNWRSGGIADQFREVYAQAQWVQSLAISSLTRGFASLDTSVDPGDEDPFDPDNVDRPPEPGYLSNLGANYFGTPRRDETFASGFVTYDNGGTVQQTFKPSDLTWTWTLNSPPSPAPTYRNAPDPAIYTNPDGSVTVAAGAQLVIPVTAEEAGTRSNAPTGSLTLTTVALGVTAPNDTGPISGEDREPADPYRNRCRIAASRLSFDGPDDAYVFFATTALDSFVLITDADGQVALSTAPLLNASGNPVNITRAQVTQQSSTGIVDAWFASPAGAASGEDVTAANTNIEQEALLTADAITYTGQAATEVPVPVTGVGKIKAGPGVSEADVQQAIVDDLNEYGATFPVGGVDQNANGDGVLYPRDLEAVAACAFDGLYDVQLTAPAGNSLAVGRGNVAVLQTAPGDWTITVVP